MKRRSGNRPPLTAEEIKALEAKRAAYVALDREQRTAYVLREMNEAQERYFTPGDSEGEDRALEIDQDKRLVKGVSFASDEPYKRWYGWEILDHTAGAVNFKRLNSGGAFVREHWGEQLGVVIKKSAKLDGNKSRCDLLFSQRQEAKDELQDIVDGIRCNTSLRYTVDEIRWEGTADDGDDIYRVLKWTPIHVASVSDPADFSVGFGKSLTEPTPKNLSEQTETAPVKPGIRIPAGTRTNNPTTRKTMEPNEEQDDKAQATPRNHAAEFRAIAEAAALGDAEKKRFVKIASERALEDEPDEKELKKALLADRKKHAAATEPEKEDAETAAGRNGGDRVEVISRHGRLRNFTGEGAEKRAYRFMQWFLAGPMGRSKAQAYCRENGVQLERAHTETVNEDGGYLVPEEFGNDMIDLREQFSVFRRNANVVPMTTETKSEPRRTGGLTAYFIGEGDAITESKAGWDRVKLVAKKLGVLAKVSSELNEDSMVDTGDKLIGEIAYAFSEKEDQCGFNGDGTSTYGGIRGVRNRILGLSATRANIAGLVVGSGNLWSELVLTDFEAVVALLPEYADTPNTKWFCHRTFYYNVMVKLMLAAGGVTAAEITDKREKRFMGYPVEISQVFPKTEANDAIPLVFGDLAKAAMLGDRRGTQIALSEHTDFAEDLIAIRGTTRFDINVHDVGNASGTAALRVQGPVVALVTADS